LNLIITKLKPLDQIIDMVQPHEKIFIVGCTGCGAICQTCGELQVKNMAVLIGGIKEVVGTSVLEYPCDERVVKTELYEEVGEKHVDAFMVMACGAGIQTISEVFETACIPAVNTIGLGKTESMGRYFERCKACGDCILYETGGICPVTRCAKGLMNGPCGGQADGKCEVGGWKNDCAWVLIYERLKKLGRLDRFKEYRAAKDNKIKAGPTELIWRRGFEDDLQ
jgi:ferredoxin